MDTGSVIFGIDIQNPFSYSCFHAGVVKLVDARDSKSREPQAHVGSIPTSGTIHSNRASVFEEKFSQGFSNGFDHFLAVPSLISTGLYDSSSLTGLHRLEPKSSCDPNAAILSRRSRPPLLQLFVQAPLKKSTQTGSFAFFFAPMLRCENFFLKTSAGA